MNIAYIDGSDNYYDTRVDINKLNCVQIKATVYKADIPEEVWKTNANGKQVIDVNMGNYTTTYEKDNYIDWLQNEENLKTNT